MNGKWFAFKCRVVFRVFAVLVFVFQAGAGFPQAQNSQDKKIYSGIDSAFQKQSADALENVLSSNLNSPSYSDYEYYVLVKIGELVALNDVASLEFAKRACLVIIENDVENFDAIDLYSFIDRAIQSAEAEAQKDAAQESFDEEIFEDDESGQRSETKIGKSKKKYSDFDWKVKLGIADVLIQNVQTSDSYFSVKYGLSIGVDLFYQTERFTLSADIISDIQMLTMGTGKDEIMTSIKIVPQLAVLRLAKSLFFRAGFAAHGLSGDYNDETGSTGTFVTPVAGLAFNKVAVGTSEFSSHLDYYPGHFAYDEVLFAIETGMSFLLPIAENSRTKIGLSLGLSETLFVRDDGIDNRCKLIFGAEFGNVK